MFFHLLLVLLGLRATPKEDTGLSVSQAVYGFLLTLPGELVDAPEIPPDTFLRKVKSASVVFTVPLPHHICPDPLSPLPAALAAAKFVFVHEDASIPTLTPRPYLVIDRQSK